MRIHGLGLKLSVIVGFSLFCLGVFVFLYTQAGGQIRLSRPYTVKAVVPEPINLVENSDVRLGGVKVGRVVGRSRRGGAGVVTFEIEDDYAPMYRDGTVKPRVKTLVGETYLEIDPGHPKSGEVADGDTIPIERAEEVVPLERILSTLDPETKRRVRRNLRSLGEGVEGEDLNRLLQAARPTVADGGRLVQVLRGQRRQLAGAVDDTAKVMQAFADRTVQVRTLATQARTTAVAASSRDEALREILRELPPTLEQARGSVTKLGDFAGRATPVMRDLRLASEDLDPTLRDLRPAAADARLLFRDLPGFVDRVDPLLDELAPFSSALRPTVGSLDLVLRQANPALAYLRTYDREFGSFFADTGSANDVRDALGNIARVHAVAGPTSVDNFAGDPELMRAYNALVDSGLVTILPAQGSNHYPAPGTVGSPGATPNFQRLDALR